MFQSKIFKVIVESFEAKYLRSEEWRTCLKAAHAMEMTGQSRWLTARHSSYWWTVHQNEQTGKQKSCQLQNIEDIFKCYNIVADSINKTETSAVGIQKKSDLISHIIE